jgi:hypothetical protein
VARKDATTSHLRPTAAAPAFDSTGVCLLQRGERWGNRWLRRSKEVHEHVPGIEVAEARGLDDAAENLLGFGAPGPIPPDTLRLTTAERSACSAPPIRGRA